MVRSCWNGPVLAALAIAVLIPGGPLATAGEPVTETRPDGVAVVQLTQTPCLFRESEERPQSYTSSRKADCEQINARTADGRSLKTLRLSPGQYVFRVTNQSVPYEVGFWLRGEGLGRVSLPSVSGGGLTPGATRDYEIALVKGVYHYSCPLNPTPDYTLVVE